MPGSRMFLAKADIGLPDATLRELGRASDAQLGIDAALLAAAQRALGLAPTAQRARREAAGTFHRLYEVDDPARGRTLLRVAAFPGEPWLGLMSLEARLAMMLRARGLPVPGCAFACVGDGAGTRAVQGIEWIEGETASRHDEDEGATIARLEAMARLLALIHAIRGEGFGPLTDEAPLRGACASWAEYLERRLAEHLAVCARAGAISAQEAARIDALVRAGCGGFDCPSALLHGDPGGHNFIVRDGAIAGAIDWEDSLLGDPIFDLASMCTFQPPRRHAAIVRAYGSSLEPGSVSWWRFWLYFLRIALAKTVHRLRFGYADAPGRQPAAARIQLALGHLAAGLPE